MEIYSPPGCNKCGNRAYRQIIGKSDSYCLYHWRRLSGHDLVREYEQHMDTLRDQVKTLTNKLNMSEAREKGLRDVLKKVDKCRGITAYLSYEKEVDDLLREVSQALAKATALPQPTERGSE